MSKPKCDLPILGGRCGYPVDFYHERHRLPYGYDRCFYATSGMFQDKKMTVPCDLPRRLHPIDGKASLEKHPFTEAPKATGDVEGSIDGMDGLWNQQKCSSCGVEAIDFIVTCAFCQQAPSTGLEAVREILRKFYDGEILNASVVVREIYEAALASDVPTTEQPMCSAEGIVAAHPACEPADAPPTDGEGNDG